LRRLAGQSTPPGASSRKPKNLVQSHASPGSRELTADESPGGISSPARRFLEKSQKHEFSYNMDRLLTPNNHIIHAIKQYNSP